MLVYMIVFKKISIQDSGGKLMLTLGSSRSKIDLTPERLSNQ